MKKLVPLIFFCAYLIGISCAEAGDVFRLGYSEYRPFIWNEKGEPKGIYVDVLREVFEHRLGIPVIFIEYPPKRLTVTMVHGSLDGFIDTSTPERLSYCKTGRVPVAVGMVGAFTYRNHPRILDIADADTLAELKDFTILTYLGDDWAEDRLTGFNIDDAAIDMVAVLKKLESKRGDIVLQIEQVAQYNINKLGFQDQIIEIPNLKLDPIFYQLLISDKSTFTSIIPQLDQTLTAMLNDGTIESIYKKYRGGVQLETIQSSHKPKIRFIHYATGVMPEVINNLAETFNKENNDCRLKPIHMNMEHYKQSIKVMLAGGLPTDMLMTWAGYRTQFLIDLGVIDPIDDLWEQAELDQAFSPSTARNLTYNGHKYAVPITQHAVLFYYNKDIFRKLKIEIPKTWSDFKAVCAKLRSKGITPIALGSKERWPAQSWFDYLLARTAGLDYRQQLMDGKAHFTDPQVKHVFMLWKDLIDQGFFNKNANRYGYEDASRMVFSGEAAMTLNGTWIGGDFENRFNWKPSIDFDVFPFPVIDPNIPDVTVGVMDVILQTKDAKASITSKAMQFIANTEAQMLFNRQSGALSPNIQVPHSFYEPLQQKIKTIIDQAPYYIFGYDLSTPPKVAEIGLSTFQDFIETPDQYQHLLEKTEKTIQETFQNDFK